MRARVCVCVCVCARYLFLAVPFRDLTLGFLCVCFSHVFLKYQNSLVLSQIYLNMHRDSSKDGISEIYFVNVINFSARNFLRCGVAGGRGGGIGVTPGEQRLSGRPGTPF